MLLGEGNCIRLVVGIKNQRFAKTVAFDNLSKKNPKIYEFKQLREGKLCFACRAWFLNGGLTEGGEGPSHGAVLDGSQGNPFPFCRAGTELWQVAKLA